ncbi:hypothetical protein PR048_023158 [Dryococelus australis]|uniref:DDE Tnp4 domain-containing protein n=1 Tax=Dryococelus australis TaxID=614101 RepID=A0ABQ9GTB3_9NEOP|nr:hypothetical protein PR048_023158 [Dryococelus australis]
MRPAFSPNLKIEVTLSYLATGNSYRSLQQLFRVPKTAISSFIPEVCEVLYTSLQEQIKIPECHDRWKTIEKGFRYCWNFPGCYGAIDGKHVHIRAPEHCGSTFLNYIYIKKKTNSIVLFALVDHDYHFIYIDVGSNGPVSASKVFQRCSLVDALERGLLPKDGVIIGDDAFPLKEYLMKPYGGQSLQVDEKVFNYRLLRARHLVENAFGILVRTNDKIVCAACALHNFLRNKSPKTCIPRASVNIEAFYLGCTIEGSRRKETNGLQSVSRVGSHQQTKNAKVKREAYIRYFVNEGAVDWQNKML